MIKNNFIQLLKKYEKHHGHLSMNEFSRLTGITHPVAMKLYHGETKSIKYRTLEKISRFFNAPINKILINYTPKPIIIYLTNAKRNPADLGFLQLLQDDTQLKNHGIILSFPNNHGQVFLAPTGFFKYPHKHISKSAKVINDGTAIGCDLFYTVFQDENPFLKDSKVTLHKVKKKILFYKLNKLIIKDLGKIVNNITPRLWRYIYSRLLLHSGRLKQNNNHVLSINNNDYHVGHEAKSCHFLISNLINVDFNSGINELIHIWKRQSLEIDKNGKKYRLIKSDIGQPISIHDYTTNDLK